VTAVRWIASIGLVIGSTSLFAQPGAIDAGEFAAYTGGTFGQIATHPTVGGSSGISFSRYASVLVETSYIPMGNGTLRIYQGIVTARSSLYDFNVAVHIRIPVKKRWAPYAILAPALLYNTYSTVTASIKPPVYLTGQSDTKFGFETGGGLRYYVRHDWGVQGEYRYTISSQNFSRMLGGVFYQFDGTWPFQSGKHSRRGRGIAY
jgi:opacity protein-like surface antigen